MRFCLPIPFEVMDWIDSGPPSIPRDYQLDVLIGLAQCLTEEDLLDIESLVDAFQEYLIDEFRINQPYDESDYLQQFEAYFADVYLMASTLMAKWELRYQPKNHPLLRCRITTNKICKDSNLTLLEIDPLTTSLFYQGEFDYLKQGEQA